ncbi:MAG: hypothetical protein WC476_08770 [Phycisphaerae bacterium]|jgi:hypothetical protein
MGRERITKGDHATGVISTDISQGKLEALMDGVAAAAAFDRLPSRCRSVGMLGFLAKYWEFGEIKIGTVKRNMRGEYTAWIIEVIGNVCACASDLKRDGHDVAIEGLNSISIIPPGSEELSAMKFRIGLINLRKRLQEHYPNLSL